MRLPKAGERVDILVTGLPGGVLPGVQLSFLIDLRGGDAVIHIPGHHRGPDNCTPEHSEQADWLNGLNDLMRPSWDCQWTLHDDGAMKAFLEQLDGFLSDCRIVVGKDIP